MIADTTETDLPACGFLKLDKDRKVLSCNQYAQNLLSYESMEDILGLYFGELVSLASRIFIDSYTYPMLLAEGKADEIQLSLKSFSGGTMPVVANAQMNNDKSTT